MTDRLIDISDRPAKLSVRGSLLVIAPGPNAEDTPQPETTVPLAEIGAIVVSHPAVVFTQAVLAGLANHGASFISCDEKHMPAAMILPLAGHSIQTERFARQASVSLPVRKRLWQQVVKEKLKAQAGLLERCRGSDFGLLSLAHGVRSGDSGGAEAQGSRRYWSALFGDDFRRDRQAGDQNRHLNYGYTVLRAIVARAVCAAGLHPSLGLQHHNRYDPFCLASDLMEPFRPIVDESVLGMVDDGLAAAPLERHGKARVIGHLMGHFSVENESRTLFDIVGRTASSLVAVYAGERKDLLLPHVALDA